MKRSATRVRIRRIDSAFTIRDLGGGHRFNAALGSLHGTHPATPIVNRRSDRAYFILRGSGSVRIGARRYRVRAHDLVFVRAKQPHQISGELECLVITAPRFDPRDERPIKMR